MGIWGSSDLTSAQVAAIAPIVPTGTADSTAINAAIVAANAAGGGVVTLAPGTFDISTAVLMLSNVWLRGSGKGVTTLRLANSTAYSGSSNVIHAAASSSDITDFIISDLSINGNRSNQTLSSTQDNAYNGICVRGSSSGFFSKRFTIRDVHAYACGYHGVAIYDGCQGFSVRGLYGSGNGFRSLHIHANDAYGDSDYSVTNCQSTGNGVDTTTALQTGQLSGIFVALANTTRGTVSGCNVWDEPGLGFELTGYSGSDTTAAEHVAFIGNTIYNCGQGFKLSGGIKNVTLQGNTIRNINTTAKGAGATGIGIAFASAGTLGGDGISLQGNIITDCSSWGMSADGCTNKWKNIAAAGNIVKGCGTTTGSSSGGVRIYDWQMSSFSNNVIYGNNAGAGAPRQLYITNCQDVIVNGNSIDSGTANYPAVDCSSSASNIVFTSNYINRNSGSGTAVAWAGVNSCIANNTLAGTNTINNTGTGNYGVAFETTTAAAAATATLLNSPVAGNPTAWVNVMVDGVSKVIPAW